MTKKPPATTVQCRRSPSGWHRLAPAVQVGPRDDRRFPCGTELYLQCVHCKAVGRAILEDHMIRWDDAEKLPE